MVMLKCFFLLLPDHSKDLYLVLGVDFKMFMHL